MKTINLYCNECEQYLEDFTKKKIFHHNEYHKQCNFQCKLCEQTFQSEDIMALHTRRAHELDQEKEILINEAES